MAARGEFLLASYAVPGQRLLELLGQLLDLGGQRWDDAFGVLFSTFTGCTNQLRRFTSVAMVVARAGYGARRSAATDTRHFRGFGNHR